MMSLRCILAISLAAIMITGCVPARQFQEKKAEADKLRLERDQCNADLESTKSHAKDLEDQLKEMTKINGRLTEDTTSFGEQYRKIKAKNEDLEQTNSTLIDRLNALLDTYSDQTKDLGLAVDEQKKLLDQKEKDLNDLKESLDQQQKNNDQLQKDLADREQKVKDLQSKINAKDSLTNALKKKINDALIGFNSDELTVNIKDGKVYVSLAEQLLFKSGSTAVDDKGVDALKKLAEVLKKQKDIAIDIEGHTDNVPLAGTGFMKDNWDLSVLRATSIVRILSDAGVDPKQMIPSGRGEFFPVDTNDSKDGKAHNRRTEIILSPNLDAIFKLLDTK